jgi:hypothetical protein
VRSRQTDAPASCAPPERRVPRPVLERGTLGEVELRQVCDSRIGVPGCRIPVAVDGRLRSRRRRVSVATFKDLQARERVQILGRHDLAGEPSGGLIAGIISKAQPTLVLFGDFVFVDIP